MVTAASHLLDFCKELGLTKGEYHSDSRRSGELEVDAKCTSQGAKLYAKDLGGRNIQIFSFESETAVKRGRPSLPALLPSRGFVINPDRLMRVSWVTDGQNTEIDFKEGYFLGVGIANLVELKGEIFCRRRRELAVDLFDQTQDASVELLANRLAMSVSYHEASGAVVLPFTRQVKFGAGEYSRDVKVTASDRASTVQEVLDEATERYFNALRGLKEVLADQAPAKFDTPTFLEEAISNIESACVTVGHKIQEAFPCPK